MKKIFKLFYKTLLWSILMFYLLFTPANSIPKAGIFDFPNADKLIHLLMFLGLAFLYLSDVFKTNLNKTIAVISLIFGALLFGSISEYIQYAYIPGRSGNIWDVTADISGCILGIIIFYIGGHKIIKKIFPSF